jgi:50S ribosomal protein L16 3-hydroxylase
MQESRFPTPTRGAICRAVLGSLTPQQFLERHWQKKPLLIRGALPGFVSPLSADELAGLACEPEVESRLVRGKLGGRWSLEHGPFESRKLEKLPQQDWTLLVQDVDKWLPEVAQLLTPLRWLPDWRIDDIMISFAAPGGSVGPHTDQYDVFLLQAQGRRRWQLAEQFDPALLPDVDLKILQSFTPEQEHVCEPGDLLYLPPGVAHYGLALDACMTFSIGFRAPDQRELVGALAEELMGRASESRYRDPGRSVTAQPSRIDEQELRSLRELVRGGLALSDEELDRFLGRYLTRPKPQLEVEGSPSEARSVKQRLTRGRCLVRRGRWLLVPRSQQLWLFSDGREQQLEPAQLEWLEPLAEGGSFDAAALERYPAALPLLVELLGAGSLDWQEAAATPRSSKKP